MNASSALVARREVDVIELPIFSDLLTRISRHRSLKNHAYGGMSGFAMDDQKKIYRALGPRSMLSFDDRGDVVARQRFNRPTIRSRVTISTFERFATEWPQIFVEEGFEEAENHILWVRRDTSEDDGQGARYFQQMVGSLAEEGIARITLRIDHDLWGGPQYENARRRTASDRRKEVARRVAEHLGEFLEASDLTEEIYEDGLCRALATAYGVAAATAVGGPTGRTFEPLSVIRYGAGPIYLTLTGMVVATADRASLREAVEEGNWPFASRSWEDIKHLRLPDVTLREHLELEAAAGDQSTARNRLHFDLDAATGETGLFDSFARFHRHLPMMVSADY